MHDHKQEILYINMSSLPLTHANLRVYVIHYTRFTERRTHMEKVLKEHSLDSFDISWVTEYDREEILESHDRGELGVPQQIAASSVSLILKHLAVYRRVAQEPHVWHLILEDDVLIHPGFLERLETDLTQLPESWELFFVGLGCDLHVPWWRRWPGKRVYFRGYKPWFRISGGTSRCTEGYLIHPTFAHRLLETSFAHPPFDCPIDWLLCKAGRHLQAQSYWAEPPLLTQGAFESWTKDPSLNPLHGTSNK